MKRIGYYEGFIIKEATIRDKRDGYTYNYCVTDRDNDLIWECDTIEEAKEFIDNY